MLVTAKTVIFFSNYEELQDIKKTIDLETAILIAITPLADYLATQENIRYSTIEDYYDENKVNFEGANNLKHIVNICREINKLLPDRRNFDCEDLFMFIKLIYDQILLTHYFCQGIYNNIKPNKIILYNKTDINPSIFVTNNDDLLLSAIEQYFCSKKVMVESRYTTVSIPKEKCFVKQMRSSMKSFLSKWRSKIANQYYRLINRDKVSLLFLQNYDFSALQELRKSYKLYWLTDLDYLFSPRYRFVDNHFLWNKTNLSASFTIDEVEYLLLIKNKLEYILQQVASVLEVWVSNVINFLQRKNIKIVISASGQSLEMLAVLRAAHSIECPIVCAQHGGFYGYSDFPIHKYLAKLYNYNFIYTPSIAHIDPEKKYYVISNSKLLNLYKMNRNES